MYTRLYPLSKLADAPTAQTVDSSENPRYHTQQDGVYYRVNDFAPEQSLLAELPKATGWEGPDNTPANTLTSNPTGTVLPIPQGYPIAPTMSAEASEGMSGFRTEREQKELIESWREQLPADTDAQWAWATGVKPSKFNPTGYRPYQHKIFRWISDPQGEYQQGPRPVYFSEMTDAEHRAHGISDLHGVDPRVNLAFIQRALYGPQNELGQLKFTSGTKQFSVDNKRWHPSQVLAARRDYMTKLSYYINELEENNELNSRVVPKNHYGFGVRILPNQSPAAIANHIKSGGLVITNSDGSKSLVVPENEKLAPLINKAHWFGASSIIRDKRSGRTYFVVNTEPGIHAAGAPLVTNYDTNVRLRSLISPNDSIVRNDRALWTVRNLARGVIKNFFD